MEKGDLKLIKKYQKELTLIEGVAALLDWDQQTYMPKSGILFRAEQSAFLSEIAHDKIVSEELFNSLKRLKRKKIFGDDKLMLDRFYKRVERARKIPRSLVSEIARATSLGHDAWQRARDKNNFEVFRPYLERIVELKRKEAKLISLPGSLYNSLLDDFEEGMTAEKLKPIFEKLKIELIEIIRKIENSKEYGKRKNIFLGNKFSKEFQERMVRDVAKRMGLDEEKSRIDFSEHPFTTKIGINDVRITFNIRESPLFSFESAVHESGHALYELGLPEKHAYDVLGGTPSLGIHESQSRFWENMIGKSKDFWSFYFKKFKEEANLNNFEEFFREVNSVSKGMIRIESDEVHYCLHVILRFELELALMEGKIKVRDLPKLWNERMKEYFGKTPKTDVEGVLQDVHWSGGYFGYFPTYALGTIYASQIFASLKKKYPKIEEDIRKGNFRKIKLWLNENVHSFGSKMLAEEVIKKACGEGLNVEIYINYLNDKYSKIYGF